MYTNLNDFAPTADGVTLNTHVFERAIATLRAQGGGILYVPPGRYLSGAICLESNISLHLSAGAELIASPNYQDFCAARSEVMAEGSHYGFIFAKGKYNVGISGAGVINGNAPAYNAEQADELGYRKPHSLRPRTVIFEQCQSVLIENITVVDSPMWTLHMVGCERGQIRNIKVQNSFKYTNTDAIDLDGCRDFIVSGCMLRTADDGVCLKTSRKSDGMDWPCENILVENCLIRSHSSALKIGTESYNLFNNIKFSNCIISGSNRGLALVSRDGGAIRNVSFDNISIETEFTAPCHWGKADPIYVTAKRRHGERPCGVIEHISFSNITIRSPGAINLHAQELGLVRDVRLFNVNQQQLDSSDPDRGTYDVRPPCNPMQSDNSGMDNAYTILQGETRPWGVWSYPDGIPAVYAHNIAKDELRLTCCQFDQQSGTHWNAEKVVFIQGDA
ncbi:Glycosyl hydrolases family 28 [Vibrio xiamenensis]|uniref:Glycosyl hydrolases family 28 n=1 Tax=Vibrio xiamenensis TaxID=861298 RepID=A0A1G7XXJ8_9VIBR|nr:glycosyl hydrolase family 28 protein [Vibrio xiamenensis]SDG77485.1 Glycosyl hydrolases family 28 [Vibrio xiamenensis]SDG88887.1 Glycosyl hydrolases family 28 [Vibrio xiamenensis]